MKKLVLTCVTLGLVASLAACGNANTATTDEVVTEAVAVEEQSVAMTQEMEVASNEGEIQQGVYVGTAAYTSGEFSMTWNMIVDFNEDNTFVLNNEKGEEKGAGTYALTENCYTMNYNDDRTCTFVVKQDGTLEMTTALPYGQATIGLEEVGGINLSYHGESYEFVEEETTASVETETTVEEAVVDNDYAVAAGTYIASYAKESKMAGTVVYNYTAQLGEDGTFTYGVTFDMGGTMYDGSTATGTYAVENGKFVFTDSEGNVIEGVVSEENTFTISLMASQMAKEPYEVAFVME